MAVGATLPADRLDIFSGYPPNLRGKWEYRKATAEECTKFLRDETEFSNRLARRPETEFQFKLFR